MTNYQLGEDDLHDDHNLQLYILFRPGETHTDIIRRDLYHRPATASTNSERIDGVEVQKGHTSRALVAPCVSRPSNTSDSSARLCQESPDVQTSKRRGLVLCTSSVHAPRRALLAPSFLLPPASLPALCADPSTAPPAVHLWPPPPPRRPRLGDDDDDDEWICVKL